MSSSPLGFRAISLVLAFFIAAHAGCGSRQAPPPVPGAGAASSDPGSATTTKEGESRTTSDLDRRLDEIFSKSVTCEHGIPQYTCAECRYQLGVVKVSPELLAGAEGHGFETAVVGQQAVSAGQELNGEVKLDEGKSVFIGPRAPGEVRAIRVDVGKRVRQGEVLFEIESAELSEARAELIKSSAALELARATAQREEDLFQKKICPEKDLLEARATLEQAVAADRASRERLLRLGLARDEVGAVARGSTGGEGGLMPVRAPFAGTVLERSLNLGALVEPGQQNLLLADTSRVWVMTNVYERELAAILDQQARGRVSAEVVVPAFVDRVFRGHVDAVGGTLDEATRTAKARVVVDNLDGVLRPGMFAQVRLLLDTGQKALAVPADAVLEDEGRAFVFVRHDADYFVRRPVSVGRAWGSWVEISRGLSGGETVVTCGAFLLKSDILRSKMGAGCAD
jgi:membrane fusion protein, heavy metal efflux system